MCSNEPSGGKCWSSSVVYNISCNRRPCKGEEEGCAHEYVGETSRSCFTRGSQHLALYVKKSDSSMMWRHTEKVHGGMIGSKKGIHDFTMKRLSTFGDCLTRIVEEAVEIKEMEGNIKVISINS